MSQPALTDQPVTISTEEYQNAMRPYAIVVEWSELDGCYVATIPDVPGTRAGGATREEAIRNSETVLALTLATLKGSGHPNPEQHFTAIDYSSADFGSDAA
jgi:predicted RNase H-like HicB family nuclease